jgi:hypothetical protein
MEQCIHHWRQDGSLRSPFTCVRCGEAKYLETNFYDIQENRGHAGIFNPSFGSPRVARTPTAAV